MKSKTRTNQEENGSTSSVVVSLLPIKFSPIIHKAWFLFIHAGDKIRFPFLQYYNRITGQLTVTIENCFMMSSHS